MEYEVRSRAVARCGVPAGCTSRVFTLAEFADAVLTAPDHPLTVYVERDASGRLAGCGGAGAELAAACARLAPHPPARTAALQLAGAAGGSAGEGGALRLNCVRALAPHDELLLWPDDALLAIAAVPVLAPIHIRGGADYRCDLCGAHYDQPNPLKMHLYLGCAPPSPLAFWRRLLAHLAASIPPPAPAQPPPSPAALEALAAAWGAWNARGTGHACLYCGKLYSRKYGLKIHIRTHTGYKPLRCGHCARRFGDPSNLNKHVRLHAAAGAAGSGLPARHACAHCGAVLARRRDLERHIRARHTAAPPSSPPSPALPAG